MSNRKRVSAFWRGDKVSFARREGRCVEFIMDGQTHMSVFQDEEMAAGVLSSLLEAVEKSTDTMITTVLEDVPDE